MFDWMLLNVAGHLPITIGDEVLGPASRACPGCQRDNSLQRHEARARHDRPTRFVPPEVLVCTECGAKSWDEGRFARILIVVTLLVPCILVLGSFASLAGYGALSLLTTEGVELNGDTGMVAAASLVGLLVALVGIAQTARVAKRLLERHALVVVPDRLFLRR